MKPRYVSTRAAALAAVALPLVLTGCGDSNPLLGSWKRLPQDDRPGTLCPDQMAFTASEATVTLLGATQTHTVKYERKPDADNKDAKGNVIGRTHPTQVIAPDGSVTLAVIFDPMSNPPMPERLVVVLPTGQCRYIRGS